MKILLALLIDIIKLSQFFTMGWECPLNNSLSGKYFPF